MASLEDGNISHEKTPLIQENSSQNATNTQCINTNYLTDEALEYHFGRASTQEVYARQETSSLYDTIDGTSSLQQSTDDPLLYKTYHRRWYILLLFSLVAIFNNILWNTWGPLADATAIAWHWDEDDIALLANWGSVSFLISVAGFVWGIEIKGLRWSTLIAAGLQCAGAGFRCITSDPPLCTGLIHVGQMLNGLAMPLTLSGVTAMSATWFPVHQRTTATAISTVSTGIGVAVSFIIGPLLVTDLGAASGSNVTTTHTHSIIPASNASNVSDLPKDVAETRLSIMRLMYIEFGLSALLLLLLMAYFPAKPPSPPSKTASLERVDFRAGIKALVRMRQFWGVALCYAVSIGVFDTWFSVLAINLQPLNVDEVDAGWIGFYGILLGNIIGMLVSLVADQFSRRLKLILTCMYSCGLVTYLVFTLVRLLPHHIVVLYVTNILGSVCLEGACPLFYELLCESTYPVAEIVTTGAMTTLNNLVSLIFYLILILPMDTSWLNWALVASLALCLPVILTHREEYRRMDVDTVQTMVSPVQQEDDKE